MKTFYAALFARRIHQSNSQLCALSLARLFHALLLFLSLFIAPHTQTFAQDKATDDEDVIRVRTDLIAVPLLVTDKNGRRISGLTQSDFQVRDNGHAVKPEYFAAGTTHVALIFALDASGSARGYAAKQSAAAINLFSRFGKRSSIAVLRFNDAPQLAVPFTGDANEAREAFVFQALANQHTAIFDAARAAVHAFDARATDAATRRIVILMSDGLDTASRTNAASVINEARERGVSFYVIHFPLYAVRDGTLAPRSPSKGFRELATQTGGNFFRAGNADSALDPRAAIDLTPVFRAIEEDLASQYVLGYYATEAAREKGFHRIEVEAQRDKRKLRVGLLRQGYTIH
ncbi:MAG: VWA domain-containing protein [Pyrinomonadaceae bacterium]